MSSSSNCSASIAAPGVVLSSDSQVNTTHLSQSDFDVLMLEGRNFVSPILATKREFRNNGVISDSHQYIMFDPQPSVTDGHVSGDARSPTSGSPFLLKMASPRATLHFNPKTTVIGIVTCGGLCPGLNDVIRSLTLFAHGSYKVKRVIGFRYGYWGLSADGRSSAVDLTPASVGTIHRQGGTMLGSSRGDQDVGEMVDTLQQYGVNILFTAGGDGTQKGSLAIEKECRNRGLDIAVVGIPKTIDSDISVSHRTFGYQTAVEESVRAIRAAHAEASSHEYGIGVVTLMGRHSGFIAAQATIASAQANICLIPEVAVTKETFLKLLETRFRTRKYCVVVVAEGFGQEWEECRGEHGVDASGNKKNANIGLVIKQTCEKYLKEHPKFKLSTVKYIDPSYMIRACPANPSDAAFCTRLCSLAVHEAMAGSTGCVVSEWFGNFVLVPTALSVCATRKICPQGHLWRLVRDLTVDCQNAADFELSIEEIASEPPQKIDAAQIMSLTSNAEELLALKSGAGGGQPPTDQNNLQSEHPKQKIIVMREAQNASHHQLSGQTSKSTPIKDNHQQPPATSFAQQMLMTTVSSLVTAAVVITALKYTQTQKR